MNQYYINGVQVTRAVAFAGFSLDQARQGADGESIRDNWESCHKSEDARDVYLPSHIEIIVGGNDMSEHQHIGPVVVFHETLHDGSGYVKFSNGITVY